MLREMVISAVIAGFIAALAMTLVQSLWVSPLILQAEVYEHTSRNGAAGNGPASNGTATELQEQAHDHDATAWKPEDGWSRRLFTFAATTLMGVGYAFLLTAVYIGWRHPSSAVYGMLYGVVGFLVFFAAPGIGLAPELPGTAAAELASRQHWWLGTVVATAAGFALIFVQSRGWLRAVGVALVIAPHLISAPHPAVEGSLAPAALQSHFVVATTVCSAIFWLVLGASSAVVYKGIFLAKIAARD